MKLLTAQQMQRLDREAVDKLGIPSIVLMENAARALCLELAQRYPVADGFQILALAGKGNNGGDAIAAARILSGMGYPVALALLVEVQTLKKDPALQLDIYTRLGLLVDTVLNAESLALFFRTRGGDFRHSVVLDGLFGVGLQSPIESGIWADFIEVINAYQGPVVAVDLPSGTMETAVVGGARVKADMTVTFQEPKAALIRPENRGDAGVIRVVDIGIPKSIYETRQDLIRWIDQAIPESIMRHEDPFSYKNRHGHGLAVVGSERMPGAGVLSVRAAFRGGIGLCTAMIPGKLRDLFITSCPETILSFREESIDLDGYSTVLIGPGLGRDTSSDALMRYVFSTFRGHLILDADALNFLAETGLERSFFPKDVNLILTPHVGEMARLLGIDKTKVEADRVEAAHQLSSRFQATVVLKGKYSLVCSESGRLSVNPTGNSGMAAAGCGDVLSGLVLGMTARFASHFPIEQIVCGAVWLHGRSGDLASVDMGRMALKAGDLIDYLPMAMKAGADGGIQI